jgi:glutathione S-transferase
MKLFYSPRNASMAPHFVLEESGQPFELEYVDRTQGRHKSPARTRAGRSGNGHDAASPAPV